MAPILRFVAVAGLVVLAACGSDGDDESATTTTAGGGGDTGNACPVDNCNITITGVEVSGDELDVTWDANFDPDVSRNHVHVYWNTYAPEQVSADAETTHGVDQGDWVPTDANPTFTTEGPVSLTVRGDADQVCVTAADRDHNVIDIENQHCWDVTDLVS